MPSNLGISTMPFLKSIPSALFGILPIYTYVQLQSYKSTHE